MSLWCVTSLQSVNESLVIAFKWDRPMTHWTEDFHEGTYLGFHAPSSKR